MQRNLLKLISGRAGLPVREIREPRFRNLQIQNLDLLNLAYVRCACLRRQRAPVVFRTLLRETSNSNDGLGKTDRTRATSPPRFADYVEGLFLKRRG
jgi:hypothetical protein